MLKKQLLIILILLSSFAGYSQTVTPQWKAGAGYILNYYPGKSPSGYDTLAYLATHRLIFKLKADSVNNDGYLTHGYFNTHLLTFNNGLTNVSNTVGLGGVGLIGNTSIPLSGNNFSFTDASTGTFYNFQPSQFTAHAVNGGTYGLITVAQGTSIFGVQQSTGSSQLFINTSNMYVQDNANSKGLVNNGDYSPYIITNDNALATTKVVKKLIDSIGVPKADSVNALLTASQGVARVGNDFQLGGGALTSNVIIDAGTHVFGITGSAGSGFGVSSGGAGVSFNNGTNYSSIVASNDRADFGIARLSDAAAKSIVITPYETIIYDQIGHKMPIAGGNNYSVATDSSFTHKRYVDSIAALKGSLSQQTTNTANIASNYTAIGLKQPRIIPTIPTASTTRPVNGDSVAMAIAKLRFRDDSTTRAITAIQAFSTGVTFFGNSISYGNGSKPILVSGTNSSFVNGYAYLVGKKVGGPFLNYAKGGDQIADLVFKRQFSNSNPQGGAVDPLTIIEIGTNDVTTYNSTVNKQTIFKRSYLSSLAWAGIPQTSKVFGQAFSLTGFTADATQQAGLGIISTTNGNTATGTITTNASSNIYLWYLIRDGNTGTFTVSVDGTPISDPYTASTTITAYGDGGALIATQNSITSSVACLRIPVASAGSHTVLITNNGTTGQTVLIYGMGTNPTTSTDNPYLVTVTPNHQNNANDALSGTYSGFESTIVTQLQGDGLNITTADTRTALGTNYATYYDDTLHPNNAGHVLMSSTIIAILPSKFLNGPILPNVNQVTQNVIPFVPLNPSQFFTPNGAGQYQTTTFNPGINWVGGGGANGSSYYTNVQPATGITNSFSNAGSTVGFSVGPYGNTSGFGPTVPAPLAGMYLTVATNGSVKMFVDGSNVSTTFLAQNNAVALGNVGGFRASSFNSSFANNYISASTAATSGANQNSPAFLLSSRGWTGSVDSFDDIGFKNVIAAGSNPATALTLVHANGAGFAGFSFDISAATKQNKLGSGLFAAGTTSLASLNIPNGVAPTSPVTGDIWFTTPDIKYYDGTATRTVANLLGTQTINNKAFATANVYRTPTGLTTDSVTTKSAATGQLGAVPVSNFLLTNATRTTNKLFGTGSGTTFAEITLGTGLSFTGTTLNVGTVNRSHTIFTPTTGGTVTLVSNQYNIINPAGALVALTVTLPSSPSNNDTVEIKFTQSVTTVTYNGGTVADGITSPIAGGYVILSYDSASTTWY